MADYPPEPWRLRGQMYLSLWRLPRARLFGTAWVRYEPGGDMSYDELLSATPVRSGARPAVTIVDIWVDSPRSLAGGRELWGIPKELATFHFKEAGEMAALAADGSPIAAAGLRLGPGLPGRVPFRFTVRQTVDGRALNTPVRGSARPRLARIRWTPSGPLSYLAGRRPFLSVALTDFHLTFGPRHTP